MEGPHLLYHSPWGWSQYADCFPEVTSGRAHGLYLISASGPSSFSGEMATTLYSITFMQSHFQTHNYVNKENLDHFSDTVDYSTSLDHYSVHGPVKCMGL